VRSLLAACPRLAQLRIDPKLIGTVIGPGGRTIKGITERTNTKIGHRGWRHRPRSPARRRPPPRSPGGIIEGLDRRISEASSSANGHRVIPIGAFVGDPPRQGRVISTTSQLSEASGREGGRRDQGWAMRHPCGLREIDNRGVFNLHLARVSQEPVAV